MGVREIYIMKELQVLAKHTKNYEKGVKLTHKMLNTGKFIPELWYLSVASFLEKEKTHCPCSWGSLLCVHLLSTSRTAVLECQNCETIFLNDIGSDTLYTKKNQSVSGGREFLVFKILRSVRTTFPAWSEIFFLILNCKLFLNVDLFPLLNRVLISYELDDMVEGKYQYVSIAFPFTFYSPRNPTGSIEHAEQTKLSKIHSDLFFYSHSKG